MADALAWHLNKDGWKAACTGFNEIDFTNEDGERFLITVTKFEEDDD